MVVGWRTVPPAAWLRVAPSAEVGELEWMVQVGPAGGTERCRLPCERQITNGCAIWTSRLGVVCCRVGKKPSLRGVHRNPIGVQLIVPTAAGLRAKRSQSCCRKVAPTVSNRRRRERKLELRNPHRAASIASRSTRSADSFDECPRGFWESGRSCLHR